MQRLEWVVLRDSVPGGKISSALTKRIQIEGYMETKRGSNRFYSTSRFLEGLLRKEFSDYEVIGQESKAEECPFQPQLKYLGKIAVIDSEKKNVAELRLTGVSNEPKHYVDIPLIFSLKLPLLDGTETASYNVITSIYDMIFGIRKENIPGDEPIYTNGGIILMDGNMKHRRKRATGYAAFKMLDWDLEEKPITCLKEVMQSR